MQVVVKLVFRMFLWRRAAVSRFGVEHGALRLQPRGGGGGLPSCSESLRNRVHLIASSGTTLVNNLLAVTPPRGCKSAFSLGRLWPACRPPAAPPSRPSFSLLLLYFLSHYSEELEPSRHLLNCFIRKISMLPNAARNRYNAPTTSKLILSLINNIKSVHKKSNVFMKNFVQSNQK